MNKLSKLNNKYFYLFIFLPILVVLLAFFRLPLHKKNFISLNPVDSGEICAPYETLFYGKCVPYLNLFGQSSFTEASRNSVVANKIDHASGIVIDTSSKPNRVFVPDRGNNRILGFNSLGVCDNSPQTKCTNNSDCSSGFCKLDPLKKADIVLGQKDFNSSTCNEDSNLGMYNAPSDRTLCLIDYPEATNIAESWTRLNIDVDLQGNVYVPDIYNNRVLVYFSPLSSIKSGGLGDGVADFVIGQVGFNKNNGNHGDTPPSDETLSISKSGLPATSSTGVSVDLNQNVWVADRFNARVLRFPKNSTKADLVIGQSNFVSNERVCDGQLSKKLCAPTLAKVDPETGELYVINEIESAEPFSTEIFVYRPPFNTGMSPAYKIVPKQNRDLVNSGWKYSFQATGLSFNFSNIEKYKEGKIWVSEHIMNRVSLLDTAGNVLETIGSEGADYRGCDYGYYGACMGPDSIFKEFNICWPGGSVGIDNDNNLYLADESFHRIARVSLPYERKEVNGLQCIPKPSGGLFDGMYPNSISGYKIGGNSVGAITYEEQLILKDSGRYLVWNNYLEKPLGSKADFVIGQNSEDIIENNSTQLGSRSFHTIDDKNRLWTGNTHGNIIVYSLPLKENDEPLANFVDLYWSDNNEKISYKTNSLAFDSRTKKMYVNDYANHRVLRIANYENLDQKLLVDKVIGQPDKKTVLCNHTYPGGWVADSPATSDSLCGPYQIEFDKLGNLFIVENNYECHGNNRIVVYTKEDLDLLSDFSGIFKVPQIQAKKVFISKSLTESVGADFDRVCDYGRIDGPFSPVSIAFNSKNNMVVGNDGYFENLKDRSESQIWLYLDPLKKDANGNFVNDQRPDKIFYKIPMGAPGEIKFDKYDNLILQDHTWSRLWVLNPQFSIYDTNNDTHISLKDLLVVLTRSGPNDGLLQAIIKYLFIN